jgi:hypothetical protein
MRYDKQTLEVISRKVATWKQSGLSQKAYCQQNNLNYFNFQYWCKICSCEQRAAKEDGFVSLNIKTSTFPLSNAAIEILLPDGKRILFHQPVSADYLKCLIS